MSLVSWPQGVAKLSRAGFIKRPRVWIPNEVNFISEPRIVFWWAVIIFIDLPTNWLVNRKSDQNQVLVHFWGMWDSGEKRKRNFWQTNFCSAATELNLDQWNFQSPLAWQIKPNSPPLIIVTEPGYEPLMRQEPLHSLNHLTRELQLQPIAT